MNPKPLPDPPSAAEVAEASRTLLQGHGARLDNDALHERLACAAALLSMVTTQPTGPSLIHASGDHAAVIPIVGELVVGRHVEGPGCIPESEEMSRRHFSITAADGCFIIKDLQSRNGTWIDGVPDPVQSRVLRDGDFILAGSKAFLFVNPALIQNQAVPFPA